MLYASSFCAVDGLGKAGRRGFQQQSLIEAHWCAKCSLSHAMPNSESCSFCHVGDRFGESLEGSQAPPSFWEVPRLPRKFPKLPRKFFGGFPGGSLTVELNREEHSMDQYRSRLKLSENFERHSMALVHTFSWGDSYGPIIGPYLFLGKFVWTNGPERFSKVSPYTGIGPWMALPS